MSELNLFWPVYKNLEKEVLKIADYIHFSDDQTKVYSMHIADLIVRCTIEIEAISKELYLRLKGNENPIKDDVSKKDLYFDTDCIDLLVKEWKIDKKKVIVSAPTFYFECDCNRILTPLKKANKSGDKASRWKKAYQALKHSRKDSLSMATIENLLNAMGALYILNLYYREEKFDIGRVYMGTGEFDNRVGSDIFSIFTYKATGLSMNRCMDDSCIIPLKGNDIDRSTYIIKYDDESFKEMAEAYCKDSEITINNFYNSEEIAKFLEENPDYEGKTINEICMAAGGVDLLSRIMSFTHQRNNRNTKTEAIINKHTNIYHTIPSLENENV